MCTLRIIYVDEEGKRISYALQYLENTKRIKRIGFSLSYTMFLCLFESFHRAYYIITPVCFRRYLYSTAYSFLIREQVFEMKFFGVSAIIPLRKTCLVVVCVADPPTLSAVNHCLIIKHQRRLPSLVPSVANSSSDRLVTPLRVVVTSLATTLTNY